MSRVATLEALRGERIAALEAAEASAHAVADRTMDRLDATVGRLPDDDTDPPLFASNWMTQVAKRIADFEFTHDPRTPSGLDNTKNYFFSRYGIPRRMTMDN